MLHKTQPRQKEVRPVKLRCVPDIEPNLVQGSVCPFHDGDSTVCGAALSIMATDIGQRESFCLDADRFDDCPMFLGSLLRPN